MKKILLMLAMILPMITFIACSNDDKEQEVKIPITLNELQGSWHNSSYGIYRHITFEEDSYSYYIMSDDEITHREYGTYTINGINITFTSKGEMSKLDNCEIYWEDDYKNYLHIYPIGTFIRAD